MFGSKLKCISGEKANISTQGKLHNTYVFTLIVPLPRRAPWQIQQFDLQHCDLYRYHGRMLGVVRYHSAKYLIRALTLTNYPQAIGDRASAGNNCSAVVLTIVCLDPLIRRDIENR